MTCHKTKDVNQALKELIPGGVSSPVRALKGAKRDPLVLESAQGDTLTDIDGNQYIDFCASWGALILGHSDPGVVDVLTQTIQNGTTYGVTSILEKELAQRVIKCMPSMEKVRFVSSGTEATMYALRLARGVTGKNYIVKYKGNYHGCADFLLTEAGSGFATHNAMTKGVPNESVQYTLNLPYNDMDALNKLFEMPEYKDQIAAVIIEPVAANMGCVLPENAYIKRLREITQQNNTLLIFDEVVTGFRIGLGGASEYFGVDPDLICLGKIVGGGIPAAAYGGKKKYMDQLSPLGPIYQAGTLSGNPLAMAAGAYVIDELSKPDFYTHLNHKTNDFLRPIEDKLSEKKLGCVQKIGPMFSIFFGKERVRNMDDSTSQNQELFWKFFNYLLDRGIYWPPSPFESSFMMLAHKNENLLKAQSVILQFIDEQ